MAFVLKSETIKDEHLLYVEFPQEISMVNFGPSKIPKCQFCLAYLSLPTRTLPKTIKTQGQPQSLQNKFFCALCGGLSRLPNNLPINIEDLPQCYKVEILPNHQQDQKIPNFIPVLVLLIDRNYPLLQYVKEALTDILGNLDGQQMIVVCVYDEKLAVYDLSQEDIIEYLVDEESLSSITNYVKANCREIRQNLSILLDILAEKSTYKQDDLTAKKKQGVCSTYNGSKHLKYLHQALQKTLEKERIKSPFSGFRILWLEYLPISCFWTFNHHPRIYTESILFDQSPIILQELAKNLNNLIILSQNHSIKQLHYTLYEILSSETYFYFTANAKGKIKYSVELAYPGQQTVRNKSLGIILREMKKQNPYSNSKSVQKTIVFEERNAYQVSCTFYDPENHKKYLCCTTFAIENCHPSKLLSSFAQIRSYFSGNAHNLFTGIKFKQDPTQTQANLAMQLISLQKDPVRCSEIISAWKQGNINGTYIIYPILKRFESHTLFYCYRCAFSWTNLGKKEAKLEQVDWSQYIESFNEKCGIYFSRYDPCQRLPVYYQVLQEDSDDQLFQEHFYDVEVSLELETKKNPEQYRFELNKVQRKHDSY